MQQQKVTLHKEWLVRFRQSDARLTPAMKFSANYFATVLLFAMLLLAVSPLGEAEEYPQGTSLLQHEYNVSKCRPWLLYDKNAGCQCSTYDYKGVIKCDNNTSEAKVLDCYCATLDESKKAMVVGSCIYNCENDDHVFHDTVYHRIEEDMCEQEFNRTGVLCGQCVPNKYPLMYSFDMVCVDCDNDIWHWVIFSLLVTIPSTSFFIFVLLFKINVMSSYLHGFILYSQGISIPASMRLILRAVSKHPVNSKAVRSIAAFYGFWNLDFFRTLMPQLCVRLTTLQALSLDYIVALYPLLLIGFSYFMVHLYYKKYKVVVFLSRPLRAFFSRFQRTWNMKSSLVDTYVTFFLLSYMKFLGTSFDLLMPTYVRSDRGGVYVASYYDANLRYFGHEHLPMALTALSVLIIFILFPTLLILVYPFRYFQNLLRMLHLNTSTSFFELFVSHFHRCYKDGSEPNTRDCRWFAALFLIVRIFLILVYAITLTSVFFPLAVIIIFIFVMILISVKPYKAMYTNNIKFDATFLLLLSLFYLSIISIDVSSVKDHRLVHLSFYIAAIFGAVPLVYVIVIIFLWIISKRNYAPLLIKKLVDNWKFRNQNIEEDNSDVPDRLNNPSDYDASKSGSMRMYGSGSSDGVTY